MNRYTVYVSERGKRPRLVDVEIAEGKKIPSTIEMNGRTYYWTGAEIMSTGTALSYSDWKPTPATVAS